MGVLLVVVVLAFDGGEVGYGAAWAFVWAWELANGTLPAYEAAYAPTPHPLQIALLVPAALVDSTWYAATLLLADASLVAAVVLAALIGREFAGRAGAWLAGAALLLGTDMAGSAAFGATEVPFVALVLGAILYELRCPRQGVWAFVLLAFAGLLRPEAWPLTALLALWYLTSQGLPRRRKLEVVALAGAAPIIWVLSDLIITGDPFHTLTGTQALAEQLERRRGLLAAIRFLDDGLRDAASGPIVLAGLLGGAALVRQDRRALIVVAAGLAGLANYFAIGVAELPVLTRYLVLPAAVLAVMGGAGAALVVQGGRRVPILPLAASASLVLGLPGIATELRDRVTDANEAPRLRDDIVSLVRQPAAQRVLRSCPRVSVPTYQVAPYVLLAQIDKAPDLAAVTAADRRGDLRITATDPRAAALGVSAAGARSSSGLPLYRQARHPAAGDRIVGRSAFWRASTDC